jgi:hypothetical protein
MLYTSPWAGVEPTISVVIGTDFIGSCKSNYHMIIHDLDIQCHMSWCFFVFSELRWEVIVYFCWYWWNCWPSLFIFSFHGTKKKSCKTYFVSLRHLRVISWQSVLLVEETKVPEENHRPVVSHWQTLSHNVVHLTLSGSRTNNISGDRNWFHRLISHLPPFVYRQYLICSSVVIALLYKRK